MAEITGAVHHINVSVSDLERSKAWYEDLFGLRELARLSDDGGAWSKVLLAHPSGFLVGLTKHSRNDSSPFDEGRCGFDHVALVVGDADVLRSWIDCLNDAGVESSEIKTTPLGSLITFRDPDNIQFELYAPHGR